MATIAVLIGSCIAGLGLLGLFDPARFMEVVGVFQTPTMIYAAAGIRIVFGVGLIAASRVSRWPRYVRLLGGIIFIAGMVTPFGGAWLGRTLLDLWPSWGPGVVWAWGGIATVLGGLVIYSFVRRRRFPRS
jgi:multisubunit Na+/H+ antiporter MnhG subunit